MAKASLSKKEQIRLRAEEDFVFFIQLVHPHRVLGLVHVDLARWMTRQDAPTHQLVLMPRDHGKSALAGYYAAWLITRDPAIRILYISSTSTLAVKQLKFIKDILTCDAYRFYWPEMVNLDEAKREKWTETEICVDHPKRKLETIRDATVFTGGLTTSLTGLHCDQTIMDDVVVIENAYTEEGRSKVALQYSLLAAIEGGEAKGLVVGTRYHPKDLYADLLEKMVEVLNEDGEIVSSEPLYEVFERVVEENGQFLWPRQQRKDGKWFGFNAEILARKKAQFIDSTQFRAQYYNDPNDLTDAPINPDCFQYYDPKYLTRSSGYWYFKQHRLNIFAAIDFAFSLHKKADYTAIVVIGVDGDQNYYILDIDRFKTDGKPSEYFQHILRLHQKWDFRKIRADTTSTQKGTVQSLKLDYIRKYGLALSVDEGKATRHDGQKAERIHATLQPKYDNRQIWHFRGGYCETLEQELVRRNPPHDDIKDALTSCVDIAIAPTFSTHKPTLPMNQMVHSRFGGIL